MLEHFSFGEKKHLADGSTLEVRRKTPLPFIIPRETALHEVEHAFVAAKNGTGIGEISIIPEEDSLGHVTLLKEDPIAGAAPHANGRAGTGHDVEMVKRSGMALGSACASARNIMAGKQNIIERLAGFLELRKKMTGTAFLGALFLAEQGDEVEIVHTTPFGVTRAKTIAPLQNHTTTFTTSDLPRSLIF